MIKGQKRGSKVQTKQSNLCHTPFSGPKTGVTLPQKTANLSYKKEKRFNLRLTFLQNDWLERQSQRQKCSKSQIVIQLIERAMRE